MSVDGNDRRAWRIVRGVSCLAVGALLLACNGGDVREDSGIARDTGMLDSGDTLSDDSVSEDTGIDTVRSPPDTLDSGMDADAGSVETARAMFIHNVADRSASTADVFLDERLWADNFAFRTGLPFEEVPAGSHTVAFAAASAGSEGGDETLEDGETTFGSVDVTFEADETYLAVAQGVATPEDYAANPEGEDVELDVVVEPMAREDSSGDSATSHLKIVHGVTDAPALDVRRNNESNPSFSGLSYGDATDYVEVEGGGIELFDVEPAERSGTAFSAQTELPTEAVWVLVASGFLRPEDNQAGTPANFVAFPVGTESGAGRLTGVPLSRPARAQFIHAAPEPKFGPADLYAAGALVADDLAYEQATGLVSIPAKTDVTLGIAESNSTGAVDAVSERTIQLAYGATKVVVASGVTDASNFSVAADNFDLRVGNAKETERSPRASLNFFHGAVDAPSVDICTASGTPLATELGFGEFTGPGAESAMNYTLEVRKADTVDCDGNLESTFEFDLSDAGGTYQTTVASGFLEPGNQSGSSSSFKWLSVSPDGTVDVVQPN